MAVALGKSALLRKIKGEDLFAKKARYHESCRISFNLAYFNHTRKKETEETC